MCPACLLTRVAGKEETPPVSTLRPGSRVRQYSLIEEIGEGGMGSVWKARQNEPVEREVALKLIKAGMDSRSILARFEAERQTLAILDHPNIAKIFEAGSTDEGRPFFAMELVDGSPVTDFCNDNELGITERLQLLLGICSAVTHAHQKGVIHRDLKPSNILVTRSSPHDLKVIDFGVTKATSDTRHIPLQSLLTAGHEIIGTPGYMSPEQANGEGDIDTRADIYSLGALLYEILTNSPPFDSETLQKAGLLEILRIISEETPPLPSSRLSVPGSPLSKKHHHTEPGTLKGDLDWIVMQALEKERDRRYGSVEALQDDIKRHLAHEPVIAGSAGLLYRFSKFTRKHRAALFAAVLIMSAILIGTSVAIFQAVKARNAAAKEKAARLETQIVFSDSMTDLGLNEAASGDYARAKLWFQKAAETASADPSRSHANLMRAKTFGELAPFPVRSMLTTNHWSLVESHPLVPYAILRCLNTRPALFILADLESGKNTVLLPSKKLVTRAIAFHPTSPVVAFVNDEPKQVVFLLNLETEKTLGLPGFSLPKNSPRVSKLEFSEDGTSLRVGSDSGPLIVLNSKSLSPLPLDSPFQPAPKYGTRRPDGAAFVSPPREKKIVHLPDQREEPTPARILAPEGFLSYGDGTLIVDRRERFLSVWQIPPDTRSWSFRCAKNSTPIFHPDSRHVAAYGTLQKGLQVHHLVSRSPSGPLISRPDLMVMTAAFVPDSQNEIIIGFGGKDPNPESNSYVQTFNWKTGEAVSGIIRTPSPPRSISFHPGNSWFAVGCQEGQILRIQTDKVSLLPPSKAHSRPRDKIAFTDDGNFLVASGRSGLSPLEVWNLKTERLQFPFIIKRQIRQEFQLRENHLLTNNHGPNGNLMIDVSTGLPVDPIRVPEFRFERLSFGHDQDTLLTSGDDTFASAILWRTGELLCPDFNHGFLGEHQTIAIPNTPWIAIVGNGGARFFDSDSGKEVAPPIHWPQSSGLYFKYRKVSPNGRTLAATGDREVIQMIDLSSLHLSLKDLQALPTNPEMDILSAGAEVAERGLKVIHHRDWLGRWKLHYEKNPASLKLPDKVMRKCITAWQASLKKTFLKRPSGTGNGCPESEFSTFPGNF